MLEEPQSPALPRGFRGAERTAALGGGLLALGVGAREPSTGRPSVLPFAGAGPGSGAGVFRGAEFFFCVQDVKSGLLISLAI